MHLRPLGLLLSGVVVASSACSMDATAPSSPLAPSAHAARSTGTQAGDWSDGAGRGRRVDAAANGASVYVVTIDPRRANVLRFGDYTLTVPAKAICDQSSGYGIELFDLNCKVERDAVTITAVVRPAADSQPRIDLMPEMRFHPDRTVTLALSVPNLQVSNSSPRILYCATPSTNACIDEAQFDPTLETHVDPATKTVFRRIKHFSGYFVEW